MTNNYCKATMYKDIMGIWFFDDRSPESTEMAISAAEGRARGIVPQMMDGKKRVPRVSVWRRPRCGKGADAHVVGEPWLAGEEKP